MTGRNARIAGVSAGVLALAAGTLWLFGGEGASVPADCPAAGRRPALSPDYAGVTVPPNIAPLNFVVREKARRFVVEISSAAGEPIRIVSDSGRIRISEGPWRRLLEANRGGTLAVDVWAEDENRRWTRFDRVANEISPDPIDRWLVYREMPVYNLAWTDMGCYQRDLSGFAVKTILHNSSYGYGCMNCHTFLRNDGSRMAMNVRSPSSGEPAGGLLVVQTGAVERVVATKTAWNAVPAIYLAWHPSGRQIAFSTNMILQCFHTVGNHRDTFDTYSDIALYDLATDTITTSEEVSRPDRMETYPSWSPDGRWLYFCSAPQLPIARYEEVRYDLMRVAWDNATGAWGKAETVIRADDYGLSVSHPRFSPDGRFIVFCMTKFGNFPAFSPSSDLWIYDRQAASCRKMEINSDESDAFHSWSSNGRWLTFSSKRLDGVFARPWFTHIGADGRATKPFILPQEDPEFYDSCVRIYNLPELIRTPVEVSSRTVTASLFDRSKAMQAKLDPRVKPRAPVGQAEPPGPGRFQE